MMILDSGLLFLGHPVHWKQSPVTKLYSETDVTR